MKVNGAAISLEGKNFIVVQANPELLDSPGEADMAIDTLETSFGGAPVVLMAQRDDGSPRYYGDAGIVSSLAGVPVQEMPWKQYTV